MERQTRYTWERKVMVEKACVRKAVRYAVWFRWADGGWRVLVGDRRPPEWGEWYRMYGRPS